jgi:hypothetical protein
VGLAICYHENRVLTDLLTNGDIDLPRDTRVGTSDGVMKSDYGAACKIRLDFVGELFKLFPSWSSDE